MWPPDAIKPRGDPFLPECPVIGVNAAAQAMTGWASVGRAVELWNIPPGY